MKKKYWYALTIIILTPLLMLVVSNFAIKIAVDGKTYSDIRSIPKNKVGLVLGTSKKISNGQPNPYYAYRINATIQLFQSGKIDFVLVSGDNGSMYYNEPTTFKKDLVKGGIPEDKIFLDYAGFRTLDSMVRAREIFGLDSVTVISQKFHNERAIYIARNKGLKAIGYNARDITGQQGRKVHFREYFARVKMFVDLMLNTQPKYFGEQVEIK